MDRKAREWVTVDVTDVARYSQQLNLRFRVEDRKGVSDWKMMTFIGPAQLREER